MQQGRGGMGSHKHGISGRPGKSPRLRLWERMQAEKNERKRRKSPMYPTVREAFAAARKR